ncbi:MAG: sensor histidine kinase [Clostridia bacterium]|nr:sensor histidine kinase [Clostridia bacterium]
MKELSLNILDIAENSVRAGATLVELILTENNGVLTITIHDNGCGMDEEMVKRLRDPFFTTRTTRSIGLGIPLFTLAAEQTGGFLEIDSSMDPVNHGTTVTAVFYTSHIDCAPLGDVISTLLTLIQGSEKIDFVFSHSTPQYRVELDTRKLREVLGEVPLNLPDVLQWIREDLTDQYKR